MLNYAKYHLSLQQAVVATSKITDHRSLQQICAVLSRSVMSDSLRPHGLKPTRLFCLWDSPGKNTGVGCHVLLQRILPTQELNPGFLHCQQILYCLSHQGSPTRNRTIILKSLKYCEKPKWDTETGRGQMLWQTCLAQGHCKASADKKGAIFVKHNNTKHKKMKFASIIYTCFAAAGSFLLISQLP